MAIEEVVDIEDVLEEEGDAEENDKKRSNLMNDSGQTDQERRQIRKSQRLLQKTIEEGGEDLQLEQVRKQNNYIFKNVMHTREAVLDGENMNAIASRATQQVDRLIQAPRYDADKLARKLKAKCKGTGGQFDWGLLGAQAGVCFNAVPSNVSFLNGPLTDGKLLQVKQRVKRVRADEDSEAEEENPEEVKGHTDRNADQLSAIEKSMKDMYKTLRKKSNEEFKENKRKMTEEFGDGEIPPKVKKMSKKHGMKIDAVQYLFNPKSFTQTVENLFHFSFLIKKGSAGFKVEKEGFREAMGVDSAGGLYARYIQETGEHPVPKQAIVSLTMKDWRDLCNAHNVTKGDLPHRTGSKQTKRAVLSKLSQS